LRAFQKLGKLKNPSALRPWLIQILVSQAKKSLNKKRIQDYFGLAYDDDNATLEQLAVHDAHPDLREELRDIDAKLSRVPRDWRTAWLLHRIEDMSMPETAQAINRSLSTVKRYVAAVDSVIGPKRN
jgi:RNA polymerase sigma-70 factor (ECF subfamily)